MSTPAPAVYGGDEISALVIDQGTSGLRIGFAGEDTPRLIIPSYYGTRPRESKDDTTADAGPKSKKLKTDKDVTEDVAEGTAGSADEGANEEAQEEAQEEDFFPKKDTKSEYFFGDNSVNIPRHNVEIKSIMEDGIISDWQATAELWDYAFKSLGVDPSQHPLIITQQTWNPDSNRANAMKLAFERFNIPAFYIVNSPVASMFAAGKPNGLIVDMGQSITTVTPVIDGLVLVKPSRRSRLAGSYLNQQIAESLKPLEIIARYQIASRQHVALNADPQYKTKSLDISVTNSFHQVQVERVLDEYKQEMCQVTLTDDTSLASERLFEFPNGFNRMFGSDRMVANKLFEPEGKKEARQGNSDKSEKSEKSEISDISDKNKNDKSKNNDKIESSPPPDSDAPLVFSSLGVSDLIVDTINSCDVDIRANLANNIVITGATSLTQGVAERIYQDVTNTLSGFKVRIHAPGSTIERKFSAWIGSSILASLGTFHQLWISRKEYDESGADKLNDRRFR